MCESVYNVLSWWSRNAFLLPTWTTIFCPAHIAREFTSFFFFFFALPFNFNWFFVKIFNRLNEDSSSSKQKNMHHSFYSKYLFNIRDALILWSIVFFITLVLAPRNVLTNKKIVTKYRVYLSAKKCVNRRECFYVLDIKKPTIRYFSCNTVIFAVLWPN